MPIQSKEVLIIEDAADVRMLLRKILENSGIVVTEADSIESALSILEKKTPHLILLDLNLPGASGFDFLRLKPTLANIKEIPVIVASGLTDPKSVYQAINLGAQDYLLKPYPANLLIQKARKQLKDFEYKRKVFPENARPEGTFFLKARVCTLGETSFILESLARLTPNQPLSLMDDVTTTLGLQGSIVRVSNLPSAKTPKGSFRCKVNVVGLQQSLVKKFQGKP